MRKPQNVPILEEDRVAAREVFGSGIRWLRAPGRSCTASRVQGPRQLRLWENERGSHKLLPWIAGLGILVVVVAVVLGLVTG